MTQSKQEEQNYQEGKIDLIVFINSLIEKKFLILGLTAFITFLAYQYTSTFVPNYQANVAVSSASPSSITNINKLIYTNKTKNSIFSDFLKIVTSEDVQKNVFIENDFLSIFNKENKPIDDVDNFIEAIINSVKVVVPKLIESDMNIYLNEKPYLISMQGSDAEAISKYLEILVKQADIKNVFEINKLNQQKISTRLNEIAIDSSILLKKSKLERLNQIIRIKEEDNQKIRQINDQIDRERYAAKQNRLNQIKVLSDAAKLAGSLGIIENNLVYNDNLEKSNFNLNFSIKDELSLPDWYLYGEKALLQRVELLENRKSDDPFIPELVVLKNQLNEIQNNNLLKTLQARQDDSAFIPEIINLNLEKNRLESTNLNLSNTKSINIIRSANVENISKNKNMIVLAAFIFSFIISVMLALIMSLLKPKEKTFD